MQEVLGDLINKEELFILLLEFDEHNTKESKFAYLCDKIEADIQSKVYQDMGCHHSLDEQQNNVAFKNSKTIKMIEDGANTPFDIWYEWDKSKFEENSLFTQILLYVKENNLN